MKKKLVIISAAAVLALGGLATIAGAIGSGNMSITKAATAHTEHDHSAMVEKAFQAPTTSAEGYKPFYLCNECCASDFRTSRYSVADKDENLADVVIPALTAATTADIASGDGISAINTQKFKYVDQGANKGEASSDKVESTPLFVKDSGKTAIYFSRSGMAATPNNPTGNDGCSEFRFTVPTEAAKSKSVSFSYKYMNWGTGSWAGSTSVSEPAGWTALIQFKDSGSYIGHDVSAKLTNDGEWHTLKLDYSGGTTASLTDFIFKFTDLRGYIMVSGLTYEATKDVTLKNVNADGTDGTANVLVGSLPDSPTMDGKTFLGWYDESGNKVESVTSSTATLVAHWTSAYYDESNATAIDLLTKTASDFTAMDGVEKTYSLRAGADRDGDLSNNRYSSDAIGLIPNGSGNDYTCAVTFPAIDFSKTAGAHFTFGFMSGVWATKLGDVDNDVLLNGNSLGVSNGNSGSTNYDVSISGKTVTVYNAALLKTATFELDDDTYTGKKGMTLKVIQAYGAWLLISSKFVSMNCDYLSLLPSAEAALPETPVAGYTTQLKKYNDLRSLMTEYEKTAYPVSTKMQAWIDASTAKKVLEFTDKGASVLAGITGTGASAVSQGSRYTAQENCLDFLVNNNDHTFTTMTLPTFDFSSYAKTTFSFGIGGGVDASNRKAVLWLGGVTTPEGYSGSGWVDALSASPNVCLGHTATGEGTGADGNFDTEFTSITVTEGKITFSSAKSDFLSKTYDLDAAINNGTKGLTITFGFCSWNDVVVTPFYASQI